jgi:hypothetical protein
LEESFPLLIFITAKITNAMISSTKAPPPIPTARGIIFRLFLPEIDEVAVGQKSSWQIFSVLSPHPKEFPWRRQVRLELHELGSDPKNFKFI